MTRAGDAGSFGSGHGEGMENMTTPVRARTRLTGSTTTVLGAVLFATVGSGLLGTTAPGESDFVAQNALGLCAAALLGLGIIGVRPSLQRVAAGRLLGWGLAMVWIGLAAMAGGHALAIAAEGAQGGLLEAAAIAGIPLTVGAHLIYPGTSLVGLAMLRGRRAPIALGVLLTASLPLLLIGVPLGLAFGTGLLGDVVTWASTEGQAGAAWFAVAITVGVTTTRGRRGTGDSESPAEPMPRPPRRPTP
ncbi:hypothetical protein GCM10007269_12760 [Microbacterium murale]|uniref:Integral membrane protein n=2 Tax=Microbacterium murale TaxID=1081040 RepID=A0ABQ1RK74_9MICO|nr:hypothetical protein GCM10007269_12760 [Microbacterium murale]